MYSKILARIPTELWAVLDSPLIELDNRLRAILPSATVPKITGRMDIVGPLDWNEDPIIPQIEVINGVGVIYVSGILATDVGWIDAYYGVYDYQWLEAFLEQAVADSRVQTILIVYNTPGGSVIGGEECAQEIASARQRKPLVSFATSVCASMGIRLAVESDACYCKPTSQIGSIGTKLAFVDRSENWKINGYKLELITSNGLGEESALKGIFTPGKGVSETERKFLTDQIHESAAQFRQSVMARRPQANGISFDGGWVFGAQAIKDGLVDAVVGKVENLIAALSMSRPTRGT